LPLGGRLGTGMSRTSILLGLILVVVGLLWRWSGPLRLGAKLGEIVVERVDESQSGTPWESPSLRAFQRETLARTIRKVKDCGLPPKTRAMLAHLDQLFEKSSIAPFNSRHAIYWKRERIRPVTGVRQKGTHLSLRSLEKGADPESKGGFWQLHCGTGGGMEKRQITRQLVSGGAQTGRAARDDPGNGSTEPFRIAGR
jgi:hypothetical protein